MNPSSKPCFCLILKSLRYAYNKLVYSDYFRPRRIPTAVE